MLLLLPTIAIIFRGCDFSEADRSFSSVNAYMRVVTENELMSAFRGTCADLLCMCYFIMLFFLPNIIMHSYASCELL